MSSTGHLSELDALRGQVADLSRQLAERDRSMQDLREQSQLLRTIVEGTAAETGGEFFASLVTHLTSALHVQYAIIGEVLEGRLRKIRTLAVSAGGALVDNFEYELAHTPCAMALTQNFAYFPRDVQATFPQFQRLADLGAESYCAVPLRTKSGEVVGLLVVMDTKPLKNSDYLQSLLGVFAPQITAEFERRRAEQARAQALSDLHNVIETIPDIVFALDTLGNLVKWNRRLGDVTGYSPEELLNKPALAFVPPEEQLRTAAAIQRVFVEGYAELDGQLLTKDLRVIPYHWTGALLRNSHGEPIGITGIGRDVSDKKRAETAVRESEERLALAVEGSNDILWDAHRLPGEPWSAPQTPIWWSSRVRELLGLQESDSFETLEQWAVRLHPDDKDRVFGQLAAHIEHRVLYDVEYRLRTNAGSYCWIRGRGQALWDEQGEPRRMSGSCQDITERKRVEAELQASQEKLRQALEASTTGLWDWNTETNEVSLSREWKSQLGYEEAEVLDVLESWETRLHPDDRVRALAFVQAYLANPVGNYQQEFRLQHKDGTYRWIETRASFVAEPDGRQVRLLGSHTDITVRKQTEEALRISEERHMRATAVGKVGVWELDVAAGTYYGDANLKAMFGYVDNELSTDPYGWLNLVHPDDQSIALNHWQQVVNGEKDNYNYELRMLQKDGTVIWTDVRGHAVRDHEGQVTHLFGATMDISERKQAQDALAQSEHQLRTVLDALPVGVWFTDRSGKPLFGNPAAKEIWSNIKQIGLQTPDDRSSWWETIGPANEPHRWALSSVLTTGVSSLNETFDLECLDGTKKVIRNSTVPVQSETGTILGAIVLNEDITLLRQAQAALQLTQFSVDHAVEGFFWIGSDARIFHVNASACRMLEYTWEELTTMTLHDIDPNLSSEVWAAYWEELKKKGSLTFESTYWSRMGRVLDTEVTVNYLQYEGKEYNCVIMRDIGERKRVEEALRASEERYRSLYDETPTMYFTLATDGRVLSVNRFGAEQLGYQAEELIGHSVLGLFHEQDKEAVVASLSECLATPETTKHWEFRKIRKDGSILWMREVARVAQSSTGETVMSVTCEDVTERKINEQLLATEKRILEKIASDVPLQEVLTRICQMVEELSDGGHCSILLLDRDGLHLHYGAAPSLPEAYVHAIDGVAIGQTVGSCGTAAFTRRRVIVSDIARDPLWDDFHDLAMRHGLRACWSTPVIASNGIVLGTFAVYYGEPQQPTHVDLQIIDRAAQIACIAIERKRTDESLRQNRVLLQSFVEHTPAAVAMLDRNLKYVAVSKRWYQDYRLGDRGIIGLHHYDVFPEIRRMEHWQAIHRRCLAGEVMRNDEDRLCREDGREDWLRWEVRPWVDESGSVGGIIMFTEVITERKRAESKLRLTQFTIDHAVDAVYWINRQAQILDVNEAASLMLDYSKEELCAMTVHDLNPGFQADMWPEFLAESKRRGTMVAETVHRAKNGRLIPVEVSVNYLSYEGMEYHCAFVRDITERKRVDAALRQSEERYRSLVDNAPIGIFVNEEGRFTYVNREMQRILNATSVEQLIGTTVLDRVAPEFHQIVKGRIYELMQNGQPAPTLDEQYVRLDGSRVDVAVAAIPTSFDGTPMMQVLVLDITERKRAEEALQKKNLELDHYFTSALDLLCIADITGHFRRLNKAWQSTLGYSLEELKGAKFLDYVHPDDLEATRHVLGDLTEQKEVLNFVNRYRRKDGSYRWIEWKSIPAGEFIYAAARDITDRRRMEDALRQRERDLRAALEERERISQDLHDGILQSLFAVGLALESAKLAMSPSSRKMSGASLNQAIQQLNLVMREIRNFIAGLGSDLLQGRDLPTALQHMLASLTENQATRVHLAVEARAAQAVSAEQSLHLFRVIQEAVSNCIRHGHAHEARVSLRMLKQGVRLSIRDNGCGFNPDDAKGTGHGLGNMAARAQKLGGRFTVLSKVNEGTRIVLDLPKEVADAIR